MHRFNKLMVQAAAVTGCILCQEEATDSQARREIFLNSLD
jgi:hypothetical protein